MAETTGGAARAGGYYRSGAAARYMGCSEATFYRYRRLGWVVPDRMLKSTTGGKPLPLYSAAALERALAAMTDPQARVGTQTVSAGAKRRAA